MIDMCSGAKVNGVLAYKHLKNVNVKGTMEVIRLAAQPEAKPLHFISTTSVFPYSQYTYSEHAPLIEEYSVITKLGGYRYFFVHTKSYSNEPGSQATTKCAEKMMWLFVHNFIGNFCK
jgi:nucleoside-diphosphate-sugar epimerase